MNTHQVTVNNVYPTYITKATFQIRRQLTKLVLKSGLVISGYSIRLQCVVYIFATKTFSYKNDFPSALNAVC